MHSLENLNAWRACVTLSFFCGKNKALKIALQYHWISALNNYNENLQAISFTILTTIFID